MSSYSRNSTYLEQVDIFVENNEIFTDKIFHINLLFNVVQVDAILLTNAQYAQLRCKGTFFLWNSQ